MPLQWCHAAAAELALLLWQCSHSWTLLITNASLVAEATAAAGATAAAAGATAVAAEATAAAAAGATAAAAGAAAAGAAARAAAEAGCCGLPSSSSGP